MLWRELGCGRPARSPEDDRLDRVPETISDNLMLGRLPATTPPAGRRFLGLPFTPWWSMEMVKPHDRLVPVS